MRDKRDQPKGGKTMYASISTAQVQPGKMDEFIATWRESVKPMVKEFPGLKNIYLLTDEKTYKAISFALYETKADAERTQTSGDYREAVGKLGRSMILESLVREGYEVSIQA
jgi:heme-degrading monooxygenase HmoA